MPTAECRRKRDRMSIVDLLEREAKYSEAAQEQENLLAELEYLDEDTKQYMEKVGRINELGKITGVFY